MAVYATSDWHGYYTFYKQVKNFLESNDIVIFCGDAIDRGPSSWKLLTAIMDDPQFIMLMGNHELMLCDCARQYWQLPKEERSFITSTNEYRQYIYNGGENTWRQYRRATNNKKWLGRIKQLPISYSYTNAQGEQFYITHAGCNFNEIDDIKINILWNRRHFITEEPITNKQLYIVHGHTPIQYFKKIGISYNIKQAYNQGHKINLDCGTVISKEILLYNLDNHNIIKMFAKEEK